MTSPIDFKMLCLIGCECSKTGEVTMRLNPPFNCPLISSTESLLASPLHPTVF
jgi:hypothetical protein